MDFSPQGEPTQATCEELCDYIDATMTGLWGQFLDECSKSGAAMQTEVVDPVRLVASATSSPENRLAGEALALVLAELETSKARCVRAESEWVAGGGGPDELRFGLAMLHDELRCQSPQECDKSRSTDLGTCSFELLIWPPGG
jgi:hypothetical protein